ncbi:hypothetical protein RFI_01093, partial [Reticulomyxa filosa]
MLKVEEDTPEEFEKKKKIAKKYKEMIIDLKEPQKRLIDAKEKNKKLKQRLVELQSRTNYLGDLVINGEPPRLWKVELWKNDMNIGSFFQCSSHVGQVRTFCRSVFRNVKKKLLKNIKKFIELNGEWNSNPQRCVIPSEVKINKNSRKNGTGNKTELEYKTMTCDEMLDQVKIEQNDNAHWLNGQIGLKAKCDIPMGTVLIQYCGVEYFLPEFDDIFIDTNEHTLRNRYAFELFVDDSAIIDHLQKESDMCSFKTYLCDKTNCRFNSILYDSIQLILLIFGAYFMI